MIYSKERSTEVAILRSVDPPLSKVDVGNKKGRERILRKEGGGESEVESRAKWKRGVGSKKSDRAIGLQLEELVSSSRVGAWLDKDDERGGSNGECPRES